MSLTLKELQKHAEDILPHTQSKKSSKDDVIVSGTGGKTNYRVLPNLRFAYAMPLVLLVAGIGIYSLLFTQAATPTMANLWVDGGNGTCTYSANPVAYNSATSCKTIDSAFTKCGGNETVALANDITGNQSVSGVKASPGCIVDGQDHTVSGNFNINGSTSNATFQNITFYTGDEHATNASPKLVSIGGSVIRLNNFKVHGMYSSVYFENASDFQWNGGDLGTPGQDNNTRSCVLPYNDLEPMRTAYSNNLTINGVNFYHQDADHSTCYNANGTVSSSNGAHIENIRIDVGTDGLTVKNSLFVDGNGNDSNTIFITNTNSMPNPVNLTFINNFFGTDVNPTFASNVSCATFKFLYNTFHNTPGAMGPASNQCAGVGGTWVGNLGPRPSYYGCTGTFIKNVWQDSSTTACGTDKMVSGTQFAYEKLGMGGADGFHLASTSSPAYNAGEATYCASSLGSVDHDGGARPYGGSCDAGAHEFGSTPSGGGGDTQSPTVSLTAPTGGATVTGSINVAATASDNVGVSGVQFKVDGTNIGSEDTTSPYSLSWDSTGSSNGSQTLTAVARDSAGNTSTSTGVAVTVSNATSGTNLYISPSGVDTNPCSQASPCKTINGAYAKAAAGTTILINDGSYVATATDSIAYRSALTTGNPVVVKPASGATVTFNDIELLAGNITFQGPNFNARSFDIGRYNGTRINNVTIDGLNIDAKDTLNLTGMNIASVTGLTLKNSRIGNTMAGSGASDTAKSVEFCGASATCYAADVTFEGNTFYDADAPSGSLAHLECIFAPGIQGFTVRKNRFQDCTYFDIFITVILANNQAQPRDYIIEDNLLGRTVSVGGTEGGYAINVHSDVQPNNFKYLRNTIEGALSTANGGGAIQSGGWTIAGNIISEGVWLSDSGAMDCRAGITFSYNVMPNTCGTNTTTSSTATIKSGWVSQKGPYAGDDDFNLKSTSSAINKGRPSDAGTFDFAGVVRANPPEAGAYEYGTSTSTSTCLTKAGDVNEDGSVNITDIGLVLSAYGQTTTTNCADLDKSGTVNIQDLSIILKQYGT